MAKKQWVNLEPNKKYLDKKGCQNIEEMGRIVYLEAEFDKKDIIGMATLLVEPDGDNATYYPRKELALAADLYERAMVSDDGIARFKVKLSAAGGDKFKFKASDLSGNEKELPDEYETYRQLYYQEIEMNNIKKHPDTGLIEKEYRTGLDGKRNIELIPIKSKGKMEHNYNFVKTDSDKNRLYGLAKPAYNSEKDPYCFAVAWIDCLANGPKVICLETFINTMINKVLLPVTEGQLWWNIVKPAKTSDWLLKAVFIPDGAKDECENKRIPDDNITPDYDSIVVSTGSLPRNATGKIKAWVYVAKGFAGGRSYGNNIIVVATRSWRDKSRSIRQMRQTLTHEVGHQLGMVPNGKQLGKGLIAQSTLDKVNDPAFKEYGKAAHCSVKSCVMFWKGHKGRGEKFCANCDKSVRKMDLYAPKLGKFTRFF